MAKIEVEAQFLAIWWHEALRGRDTAARVVGHIRAEMLEYEAIGDAYQFLADRFAKGSPLNDLVTEAGLTAILGPEWYHTIREQSQRGGKIGEYSGRVLFNYRARRQADYLSALAEQAAALVGEDDGQAAMLADQAIGKLATFHTTRGDLNKPVTREEITNRGLQRLRDRGQSEGIVMPYPKLAEQTGNLLPGDVVGIAGYSNSGKSVFAANLWRHFAIAGVPTISFPTEMGLAWHARGVAAHARVPQLIAEREQWDLATEEMVEAYEFGLQDLGRCPWEIVDRPSISVDEIIARASVLRRRWPGKPVVVIVDHMHRLDYGREEADFAVGAATRKIRNWAKEDDDGGIIAILLYQPRKPADEIELYRPVDGFRIRGKSEVWNELDYLLSPYRRWVRADNQSRTPWGTPGSVLNKDGFPIAAVPNAEGAKLDDERTYVKIGKRRVGGEGPTVVLNVDSPSGYIYQLEKAKLQVAIGGL
jgi:replicative DNA helicase